MRHERTIYFILIGWLLVGDWLSRIILLIPGASANIVLKILANIVSLSNLLGLAIDGLSELMMVFWRLLPFI